MSRLAQQEIFDRLVEHWFAEPVIRPGCGGREAAADLVLSLCAGLEAAESLANAVVDALVVTRLEVQAVKVREAAPVAAEERIVAAKADGRRDRAALESREDDDETFGHFLRDDVEELAVEIRLAATP